MPERIRKLLKALLPWKAYAWLRDARASWASVLAAIFSSTEWLASTYYLFDRSFAREHRAVLAGKRRYFVQRDAATRSSPLLRRNIHRLEKGLISRPRRPVFATSYIEDTVRQFHVVLSANGGRIGTEGEVRWAHDVISAYFEAVDDAPAVRRARKEFAATVAGATIPPLPAPLSPYLRDTDSAPPVTPEAFMALSRRRRSVRWFERTPVPRAAIDASLLAAGQAPSACNRLPYRFVVFDEPEMVQQVAGLPGGTRGFEHNFPVIVVIVGTLSAYFSERDRHLIYIDGSLAAMSFMLALETHGLSSCPINWPDVAEPEKRLGALLGLGADERAIMFVAVGYPDRSGGVPASEKRGLDELRTYNPVSRPLPVP